MEMYHVPGNHNYMIQDMEYTTPYEQIVADQGLFYPSASTYGYYCTGFESPSDWEEHQRVFGVDAPEFQYAVGTQNESFPYVYYTPSSSTTYGYAQSPYNPYNPYIPGATAMIGLDSSFVEPQQQQFYSVSPYTPVAIQPDSIPVAITSTATTESLFGTGTSITRPDGRGSNNTLNSSSLSLPIPKKTLSSTKNPSPMMISEGSKASVGSSKQAVTIGSNPNGGFSSQGRTSFGSTQAVDHFPNGKFPSHHNKLKVSVPSSSSGGLFDFGTHNQGQATVAKLRPSVQVGRSLEGINSLVDQNRGPRVVRPRNELAVKAYTTSAGVPNPQGNITIYTDQYNKDNFQVEYTDAKFFVIKSYSEDDVHKSIKYNVWSSTPNGNKKLNGAFEDALRIATRNPGGCPIFLFFSVNMSGQFCGVAEMIGPVDFSRDMDFWQQDKWNGSFPVKWHFIKDVPNTSLRHIVLENNENKPVTNSRDTQEIMYKKGIEMLRTFKSYTFKSCLFDDFMFYENRQKLLLEEKVMSLARSFENPFFAPVTGPPRKLNSVVEESAYLNKPISVTNTRHEQKGVEVKDNDDVSSTLKIGNPTSSEGASTSTSVVKGPAFEVQVHVGSVPLKLNGSVAESSRLGILTFGTIPTDRKVLLPERGPKKHK